MTEKAGFSKLLPGWGAALLVGLLVFGFLHEVGHGFGSQLDGVRVSTGFNRVGNVGKRPGDPDFRAGRVVTGIAGSGGFLGPLVNWSLAALFTVLLLGRKVPDARTLLVGAGALSNALLRLVPMAFFFGSAALGRVHLEDEVGWALRSVPGLILPMASPDFRELMASRPGLLLSQARVYFWPALSLAISLLCFALSHRRLRDLFDPRLTSRPARGLFAWMPVLVWPLAVALISLLDEVVRINW